ncbi:MAG TPA: hypothetical protein VNB29_08020 [Chthoniobacterales bacterium]|jgi:hypothetical protein|nr:hypothetical protein [Chthoniobacterales bacterium]
MKTLFSEIQSLFERTYTNVGINLEDCLVDSSRSRQLAALAGAQAAELAETARTFLRASNGQLRIGIYYSKWLIEQLERHDPRAGLSEHNIRELIAFVEEIDHALHAAIQFHQGTTPTQSEDYARNLELQASVDTYLVLTLFMAFFRSPKPLTKFDRRWIRFHLFESRNPHAYRDANLRERYMETTNLARTYTRYLESLAASRRVEEIRLFHALPYDEKRRHILALEDRQGS